MNQRPDTESTTPPRTVAVIDIGSSSIRLAIAEIDESGGVKTLEHLVKSAPLGGDTFTRRIIRRSTIEECVQILDSYRRILVEYNVAAPEQIRVVATSAVREARNQLAFLDRVYAATGLTVEPLDEAEVSRITYSSVQAQLHGEPKIAAGKALVLEVGGGSTELLLVRRGNVVFSQTYRLGAMRLQETIEWHHAPAAKTRQIMTNQILRTIDQIMDQTRVEGKVELIALGSDIRFAATRLIPDWNRQYLARIPVAAVEEIADHMLKTPADRIARAYHISFQDAETTGPALLTYSLMAKQLGLDNIMVSDANLRDGLLREMAMQDQWSEAFREQVIRSAKAIGRKYDYDQAHAEHVASVAVQLFQQLQAMHQLPGRFELHLQVAALLHEIGLYVGVRSHHKHAMYLIRNSELFGIGQRDLLLIALVARYHRRASPQPTHEGYLDLDRIGRIAVSQMAAMLRVAVALCDARTRRISEISCQLRKSRNDVLITVHGVNDLSLERVALSQNKDLFLDAFGKEIRILPAPT